MKLLIWLVIVAAVVTWIMRLKTSIADSDRGGRGKAGNRPAMAPEAMLQCARCGIHFPASEALIDAGGASFCCEEHRAQREGR